MSTLIDRDPNADSGWTVRESMMPRSAAAIAIFELDDLRILASVNWAGEIVFASAYPKDRPPFTGRAIAIWDPESVI